MHGSPFMAAYTHFLVENCQFSLLQAIRKTVKHFSWCALSCFSDLSEQTLYKFHTFVSWGEGSVFHHFPAMFRAYYWLFVMGRFWQCSQDFISVEDRTWICSTQDKDLTLPVISNSTLIEGASHSQQNAQRHINITCLERSHPHWDVCAFLQL